MKPSQPQALSLEELKATTPPLLFNELLRKHGLEDLIAPFDLQKEAAQQSITSEACTTSPSGSTCDCKPSTKETTWLAPELPPALRLVPPSGARLLILWPPIRLLTKDSIGAFLSSNIGGSPQTEGCHFGAA